MNRAVYSWQYDNPTAADGFDVRLDGMGILLRSTMNGCTERYYEVQDLENKERFWRVGFKKLAPPREERGCKAPVVAKMSYP